MDWLDLFAVQGTLKSLLKHHSSKASILQHSAFFIVQLSHPYMTIGKTIALTRWTFVSKAMSLLFNMLPSLVIAFLPRSKHLLISWLQSPSTVILEPKKIKSVTISIVSPSIICHEPSLALLMYTESLQSHPTLCDAMEFSPPGSSVHGILQERILEWVVMSSSRGSFRLHGSNVGLVHLIYLAGGFFTTSATWKPSLLMIITADLFNIYVSPLV